MYSIVCACLQTNILQTLGVNNSRILRIKNAKFSGKYFHLKKKIQGDFQICISVPLKELRSHIGKLFLCPPQ